MNTTKAVVIVNEKDTLVKDQIKVLERFDSCERLDAPVAGWTLEEMTAVSNDIYNKYLNLHDIDVYIVFASPIPALLKLVLAHQDYDDDCVFVFHKEKRYGWILV